MENIVLFGSSGHAKCIIDLVEKEGKYKIVGLIDKFKNVGEKVLEYGVIGSEENLEELSVKYNFKKGLIAIGDNSVRYRISSFISSNFPEFEFISVIHPNAQIGKDVVIGKGTAIFAGVIINASSKIGDHCFLNTNSSLGHDSVMQDFSSLSSNATTGGHLNLGKFSVISLGANVIHNISIGENTVIGAGSVVTKNIEEDSVAYGVPAKIIRKRELGEKYLVRTNKKD